VKGLNVCCRCPEKWVFGTPKPKQKHTMRKKGQKNLGYPILESIGGSILNKIGECIMEESDPVGARQLRTKALRRPKALCRRSAPGAVYCCQERPRGCVLL